MKQCFISKKELANMFDHTNLKPDVTKKGLECLCRESVDGGFKMVAVNSAQTAFCKSLLRGTNVHVGAAIGFPLGQTTIESKVFETKDAIQNGADEIDYVINITELKNRNLSVIVQEMQQIVSACSENNVTSKVIFENCYLREEEKKLLCEIALDVKPDYIKTSTGFGTGGATQEDVRLMKSLVGDKIKVKAAGGIRNLDSCLDMVSLGAQRIGTSNSIRILEEYDTRFA